MNLKLIKKSIFYIFILGIIYFFGNTLYKNYNNIISYNFEINYTYIILSVLLGVFVIFYWGFLWKLLVNKKEIKNSKILYIHSISWLAKYLPGKAGIIISKIYFLTKHGIEKKRGLIISIYENIFQILSAFLISVPLILYYFSGGLSKYYIYLSVFFVIGFLIFIYPKVFYFIINKGLKLFKKGKLEKKYFLSEKEIIKNLFLYSIGMILNGVAFFLMIKGITNISWSLLLPVIGLWNFAGVIGLLAIFAPAGLGVREGILTLFLGFYFPLEIATLIAVFSRLWTTISDGLVGVYVLIYKFLKK